MTEPGAGLSLVLQREVAATVDEAFEAWTSAEVMTQWWGPPGTRCIGVELDVRVGGQYRIGNELPGGDVIWITGEYLEVEPPHRLMFTWTVSAGHGESVVTVRLEDVGGATRVVVVHERIASDDVAKDHEAGWNGCLNGLARHFDGA